MPTKTVAEGAYTAPYDDAVERTLGAHINDTAVSVKTFGAQGDDSTDDTDEIANALACSDSVFFPSGIYRISSPISLTAGQSVRGVDSDGDSRSEIVQTTLGEPVFSLAGSQDNISVDRLRISGIDSTHAADTGSHGFDFDGTGAGFYNCSFTNLRFTNVYRCFNVGGTSPYLWSSKIDRIRVSGCKGRFIDANSPSNGVPRLTITNVLGLYTSDAEASCIRLVGYHGLILECNIGKTGENNMVAPALNVQSCKSVDINALFEGVDVASGGALCVLSGTTGIAKIRSVANAVTSGVGYLVSASANTGAGALVLSLESVNATGTWYGLTRASDNTGPIKIPNCNLSDLTSDSGTWPRSTIKEVPDPYLAGSGAPTARAFMQGTHYIDTATGDVYVAAAIADAGGGTTWAKVYDAP